MNPQQSPALPATKEDLRESERRADAQFTELPAASAANREKTAADREYERKLDRDLRILRVAVPVGTAIACMMVIAMTAYLIVTKL